LNGIGLSYALPSFRKAGIDSPAALAHLDVEHFEALGVKNTKEPQIVLFGAAH